MFVSTPSANLSTATAINKKNVPKTRLLSLILLIVSSSGSQSGIICRFFVTNLTTEMRSRMKENAVAKETNSKNIGKNVKLFLNLSSF
jgi:hypothetical protein